jgi:hypothetical protein
MLSVARLISFVVTETDFVKFTELASVSKIFVSEDASSRVISLLARCSSRPVEEQITYFKLMKSYLILFESLEASYTQISTSP